MSEELDRVLRALENADRAAQGGDQQAAQDARELASLARQLQQTATPERSDRTLNQVNLGIADAVGGLVDLVNPFDRPHALNPFPQGTGSARQGLVTGMQTIGAVGEDRAPEGVLEAGLRGAGQAAGAAIPAGRAAVFAARLPGIAGNVAGQIGRGLSTPGALLAETAAGGVSGAAMEASDQATEGLPEWARGLARGTAGVVAPLGLAGGVAATQAAGRTVGRVSPIRNATRAVAGAVAPYTRRGAEAVARRRMEELAGSRDRALEIGERINPNDDFGLTPAQQTGDSRFIALEQAARDENPVLDATIQERLGVSMDRAREGVNEIGGDVTDAQRFFQQERERFNSEMQAVADEAIRNAENRLRGIQGENFAGDNSLIVMEEIGAARTAARARESELWGAIPRAAPVPTDNARRVAEEIAGTSRFARRDVPQGVRDMLSEEIGLDSVETFDDLHALYSSLRREARNARAGENTNDNLARLADQAADAILEDLAGEGAPEAIAMAMNEARAFSVALHRTFDRGAIGRLSTRRIAGDEATEPELALERTVGRQGTTADTSARNLEGAAAGLLPDGTPGPVNDRAQGAILDYVRSRFADSAFSADGTLTRQGALQFARNNRELLQSYPALRDEILGAADQALSAEQVSLLVARTIEENALLPASRLADATQETAIRSILDAESPVRAAQELRVAAQRDDTGAALDGIKAVFTDELIRRATVRGGDLDAVRMRDLLQEPRFRAAINRILEPVEIRRLERIAGVVEQVNMAGTQQPGLPGRGLSGAETPVLVDNMLRWLALSQMNQTSGGPGSLAQSQMLSGRVRDVAQNLTRDRASRILADAITDPRLFQALLMDPASPRFEREALPRLLPYLVGAGAGTVEDDPQPGPLRMELTDPGNQRQ
jgi:hypothetical protein